eukprot:4474913-Pleurochrysis_carterae.AAC.3
MLDMAEVKPPPPRIARAAMPARPLGGACCAMQIDETRIDVFRQCIAMPHVNTWQRRTFTHYNSSFQPLEISASQHIATPLHGSTAVQHVEALHAFTLRCFYFQSAHGNAVGLNGFPRRLISLLDSNTAAGRLDRSLSPRPSTSSAGLNLGALGHDFGIGGVHSCATDRPQSRQRAGTQNPNAPRSARTLREHQRQSSSARGAGDVDAGARLPMLKPMAAGKSGPPSSVAAPDGGRRNSLPGSSDLSAWGANDASDGYSFAGATAAQEKTIV